MAEDINKANPKAPNENYRDAQALEIQSAIDGRLKEGEESKEFAETLQAELLSQRGTSIPALFQHFYKFIANPSSVSVETFKRMRDTDDTIGSGCDFLTTCLAARIGEYVHEDEKVTKFVNEAFEKILGGWTNSLKSILSAPLDGFSVHEKVWANDPMGFILQKLVPLPPTTILFEVEPGGELTRDGILQFQRNWNPNAFNNGLGFFGGIGYVGWGATSKPDPFARLGDLPFPLRTANTFQYLSIRIPTLKCVHYAFGGQGSFGNPYGKSLLRRCYKYYVLKDAILRMMSVALDRKGTPLTIVYVDPNTTVIDPVKASQVNGNVRNSYAGQTATAAAREAFKNVHNDSVIILPGKKEAIFDVQSIAQGANASDFETALKYCDRAILRSLLIPALVFSSGDGTGSYALGEAHIRTWDKVCDSFNAGLVPVLLESIVRDLILYNFGEGPIKKNGLGNFGKRELTAEERQKEMETLVSLNELGAYDPMDLGDMNEARARAGMPPRTKTIPKEHLGFGDEEGEEGDDGDAGKSDDDKNKGKDKK